MGPFRFLPIVAVLLPVASEQQIGAKKWALAQEQIGVAAQTINRFSDFLKRGIPG